MNSSTGILKAALFIFLALFVLLSAADRSQAITYTGSLSADGGGITGTTAWDSEFTLLSWIVQDVGASNGYILWQYDYTFSVPEKEISNIIIEVSPDAVDSDFTILSGASDGGVDTYASGKQGKSHPDIPDNIYGFKFVGYSLSDNISFTTTRAPVWGDFYAKDGKDGGVPATAWSSGFTASDTDPLDAPSNGSLDYHILRPDTVQTPVPVIPEPVSSTLFLVGGAVLGFRRFRKRGRG